MKKHCKVCGVEFNARKSRIMACSRSCSDALRRKKDLVVRVCPVCGVSYEANTTRLKFGRETTCSRKCSYILRQAQIKNAVVVTCDVCGAEFARTPSQVRSKHGSLFCSRECHYIGRRLGIVRPKGQSYVHTEHGLIQQRKAGALAYASGSSIAWPKIETEVAERLGGSGFQVAQQHVVTNGVKFWPVDIYLPDRRVVIEIDGSSHETPKTRERDRELDEFCETAGIRVIRVQDTGVASDICRAVFLALAR